jgi:hypothetical protein
MANSASPHDSQSTKKSMTFKILISDAEAACKIIWQLAALKVVAYTKKWLKAERPTAFIDIMGRSCMTATENHTGHCNSQKRLWAKKHN